MNHFIKFSSSTKENPSLLIYDIFEAHLSIAVLNLAKEHGVTILTLPPHSTHKLQPLDVGVMGPFKTAYNAAIDFWMLHNPGKTFTIYQVAASVELAFLKAITPSNIVAAFKKTGIFPYDRNVSDRTFDVNNTCIKNHVSITSDNFFHPHVSPNADPTTSTTIDTNKLVTNDTMVNLSTSSDFFISPKQFRGFPKSGKKNCKRRERRRRRVEEKKKGCSIIATDTPERDRIEKRLCNKKLVKLTKELKANLQKINKKLLKKDDSVLEHLTPTNEKGLIILEDDLCACDIYPKEEDFVLVKFETTKKKLFYVGKVLCVNSIKEEVTISFLWKKGDIFKMPISPDIVTIPRMDVKLLLPRLTFSGTNKRQHCHYKFEVVFDYISIC
ncbi:uncharacterized protein LOC124811904 isoform X1 [Hydra vulgaris]|uniref:uncharacterized protein LOC124811904 isoform X1 n=1 Tax=Hydra vulgaris TaxID=6087 RepID=UPI001F5E7341|nr:uncharacterized protein LOC124811904 isoform X1 [Hydra vulgaris]